MLNKEEKKKEAIITALELCGIVAIVWAIWLAFGGAAAAGAAGVWLLIIAEALSRRR